MISKCYIMLYNSWCKMREKRKKEKMKSRKHTLPALYCLAALRNLCRKELLLPQQNLGWCHPAILLAAQIAHPKSPAEPSVKSEGSLQSESSTDQTNSKSKERPDQRGIASSEQPVGATDFSPSEC